MADLIRLQPVGKIRRNNFNTYVQITWVKKIMQNMKLQDKIEITLEPFIIPSKFKSNCAAVTFAKLTTDLFDILINHTSNSKERIF